MNSQFFRRTCIVVLPLSLWACAAPGPAPLDSRHPANPAAASAPMYRLQVLRTYQDFPTQPARAAQGEPREEHDDDPRTGEESEHHVH